MLCQGHIEGGLNDDLMERGFEPSMVMDVLRRLERNEHKRWHTPPPPGFLCLWSRLAPSVGFQP